jgi:hypothetical protein
VQRIYQIVAAHLYRAETRSSIAEEAWAMVTAGDLDESDLPDQTVVAMVRAARARAVAAIVDGNHPPLMTESAIDTLDHAMYTAMAEAGIANTAVPSQSAFQDKPRRGPRL